MSYDEMALAALIGVSTPTLFINRGDRHNRGRPGEPGGFVGSGVYTGLVGARFERRGRMEWNHIIADARRDAALDDPLMRLWARFYGLDRFPTLAEARASDRFVAIDSGARFDTHTYRQRMRLCIEPFLFDGCGDPRHGFLETLLDALPADGSIVVHEKTAEKTVLKQLADRLGGDLADRARELVPRLFDTKDLLQAGYYHPDQQGSYSIKKVAGPMLSRAYDDLAVQDGLAAVAAWKELLRAQSAGERESLRSDLLAYCGRDTMLMHEIVREVGRIVG